VGEVHKLVLSTQERWSHTSTPHLYLYDKFSITELSKGRTLFLYFSYLSEIRTIYLMLKHADHLAPSIRKSWD
jgi:hypothetical protein